MPLRADPRSAPESLRKMAFAEVARMRPGQRYVRGLFAGGTFCYQSQAIFSQAGLTVHSNSALAGMSALENPRESREHSMVDMGAEVFVVGRPHPMIDATLRQAEACPGRGRRLGGRHPARFRPRRGLLR